VAALVARHGKLPERGGQNRRQSGRDKIHDELDGREEDEADGGASAHAARHQLGMSEYYGSEGFDRPPLDVYSFGGG
jgi:hypothetical protein